MKQENLDILNSSKSKDKKNKAGEWILNNSPSKEDLKLIVAKCTDTTIINKSWDLLGDDMSGKSTDELNYIVENCPNSHFVKVANEQLELRNALK